MDDTKEKLTEVMDAINAALVADGIPPEEMRVEFRDFNPEFHWKPTRLVAVTKGETWGYSLLEYTEGIYKTDALPDPGTKRWKMAKTPIDRLYKRLKTIVDTSRTHRANIDRRAYLCALLDKVEGVNVMYSGSWLTVAKTDFQMEVHPDAITGYSRSYGIYLKVHAPPGTLDVVIVDQIRAIVKGLTEIKNTVDRVERELKLKTGESVDGDVE